VINRQGYDIWHTRMVSKWYWFTGTPIRIDDDLDISRLLQWFSIGWMIWRYMAHYMCLYS